MRGFASKQKIEQLLHLLKKADCDEQRELACLEFKKGSVPTFSTRSS